MAALHNEQEFFYIKFTYIFVNSFFFPCNFSRPSYLFDSKVVVNILLVKTI